jgi:hypothetical protein
MVFHTLFHTGLFGRVAATSLGNWSSEDMLKTTKNLNYEFFQSIISIRYPGNEMLLEWSKVDQEACFRFLSGKLIYKPQKGNDEGKEVLRIAELSNPLGGTFNLSQCGDTDKYLNISTGYRKVKKAENVNKVEIWFTPRFLVQKEINTTAGHFTEIFPNKWKDDASVGLLWTWGGWDNFGWYDYLTSESTDNLSKINLFENWKKSGRVELWAVVSEVGGCRDFMFCL